MVPSLIISIVPKGPPNSGRITPETSQFSRVITRSSDYYNFSVIMK